MCKTRTGVVGHSPGPHTLLKPHTPTMHNPTTKSFFYDNMVYSYKVNLLNNHTT